MKRLNVDWTVVLFVVAIFASVAICNSSALAQRKSGSNPVRSLHGRVFSRDNKPVSKAVVYLKNTKTHVIETYISDPDGSYRFPWLSPRADYEVHAEFQGARTDTKFISSFDTRKEFDVVLRFQ
jgi:Carboxypeptidase regulatory-like domain